MNTRTAIRAALSSIPLKWNDLTLRAKLVIILLMVALLPLAINAFISDRNARQSALDDANGNLLGAAASVATQLDDFISAGLDSARYQAHLPVVMNYLNLPPEQRPDSPEEERLRDFLLAASYEDPIYITSIAVLDAKGTTLVDTSAAEVGVSSAERAYFNKVLEIGLPYASTVEYDHVTGKPALYFAAPIQNEKQELIGILRIRYDAFILQDVVAQNSGLAGARSFAMLLDENHVRLAHGATRNVVHKSVVPLNEDLVTRLQAQRLLPAGAPKDLATDQTDFEAGINNFDSQPAFTAETESGKQAESEQIALARMTRQNWVVAYAQPRADVLAPVNAQTRSNAFIAVLIAVSVALFGLFLAEVLADSIIRLTNTEAVPAAGEVNLSMQVAAVKEIQAPVAQPEIMSPPPIILGERAADIFGVSPNLAGGYADSNATTQTALTAQVSTAVLVEQNQAQSVSPATGRRQKTPVTEDKLEVAIRRLGVILGRARASADAQSARRGPRQ